MKLRVSVVFELRAFSRQLSRKTLISYEYGFYSRRLKETKDLLHSHIQ